MRTSMSGHAARVLVAGLLLALPFARPASAQEEKKVTVEVKDGKVYVNGQEKSTDEEGILRFTDEDGEEVVVNVRRGHGGRVFAWAPGAFETELDIDAERLHAEMERGLLREGFPLPGPERLRAQVERGLFREGFPMAGSARFSFGMSQELRALEREIEFLAQRIRTAENGDRAELEAELDAKLAEAFDQKQEASRQEAEELAQRLAELRDRLTEREAARAEVIARRKRSLLGERDALDW